MQSNEIVMNTEVQNIADFIYLSMCVDGFVKFHHFDSTIVDEQSITGVVFEVTDKRRGVFYIGWYKKPSNIQNAQASVATEAK